MIDARDIRKEYGGFVAVQGSSFSVDRGEVFGIIGPNGAGKTTFFNLLTGALEPTEGTIEFNDGGEWTDITGHNTYETAQLGIHRSYQITNVFPTVSVLENVRIASQAHGDNSLRFWRNVNTFDEHYDEAEAILDRVDLLEKSEVPAENLSHGEKRQLEVGIALAGDPDVLLLDEPNAGVSAEGIDEIKTLIEDVAQDHAVLLVEHNMDIVMDVSERVVVLNQGAVIADDKPENVRGDPKVQEAYLGGYEAGDLDVAGDDGGETAVASDDGGSA